MWVFVEMLLAFSFCLHSPWALFRSSLRVSLAISLLFSEITCQMILFFWAFVEIVSEFSAGYFRVINFEVLFEFLSDFFLESPQSSLGNSDCFPLIFFVLRVVLCVIPGFSWRSLNILFQFSLGFQFNSLSILCGFLFHFLGNLFEFAWRSF